MEKRIKYGTILLIFLITSLLVYGYFYHISGDSPVAVKSDNKISAYDLISLVEKDDSLFDRRYLYKILSVGGVIKDIKRNKAGGYTLCLRGYPDRSTSINCSLDSLYNHRHLSLQTGDSCSIRGACAGHLADVVLVQCIIEK